jgi:hypothetical protein
MAKSPERANVWDQPKLALRPQATQGRQFRLRTPMPTLADSTATPDVAGELALDSLTADRVRRPSVTLSLSQIRQ